MHKIKEMLHMDSDEHKNTTHAHDEKHVEVKHTDVKHTEVKHQDAKHLDEKHHEKHVYNEREVATGGNLYQHGVDPTKSRDVTVKTAHDGGITKERIGEEKVVKETVKEVELHKVQPVVHRDREQKEIRHIVEPHKKVEVADTKVLHKEKEIDLGVRHEESTLATTRAMGVAPRVESSREVITEKQHQDLPVQVQEHVHKKVEEHIHPVIYKETLKPKVTEEVHHVYETVKEKPIETFEVRDVTHHGDRSIDAAKNQFLEKHTSTSHVSTPHVHTAGQVMRTDNVVTTQQHDVVTVQHPATMVSTSNVAYDAALAHHGVDQHQHSSKDVKEIEKMQHKDQHKETKKHHAVV